MADDQVSRPAQNDGGVPRQEVSEHDEEVEVFEMRFGRELAGFTAAYVCDYEGKVPGLGKSIAYSGGQTGEATLYVYDKQQNNIPDGPESQEVYDEFQIAIRDVFYLAERNGHSLKLLEIYVTGSPAVGAQFLCAELQLLDERGEHLTCVYMTGAKGRYLKLRMTLPRVEQASLVARTLADDIATCIARYWT
jgi:hypothetical protein